MGLPRTSWFPYVGLASQTYHYAFLFMILFHTVLAVGILVGFFDGVNRVFSRNLEHARRDDLIRRGYIL